MRRDTGKMKAAFEQSPGWRLSHATHPEPTESIPIGATGMWQKRVEEGSVTKFFISVEVWEHLYESPVKTTYAPSVRFYLQDRSYVDVALESTEALDLAALEETFSGVYEKLQCIPDIHNQR